jgi:hypothetical protein
MTQSDEPLVTTPVRKDNLEGGIRKHNGLKDAIILLWLWHISCQRLAKCSKCPTTDTYPSSLKTRAPQYAHPSERGPTQQAHIPSEPSRIAKTVGEVTTTPFPYPTALFLFSIAAVTVHFLDQLLTLLVGAPSSLAKQICSKQNEYRYAGCKKSKNRDGIVL